MAGGGRWCRGRTVPHQPWSVLVIIIMALSMPCHALVDDNLLMAPPAPETTMAPGHMTSSPPVHETTRGVDMTTERIVPVTKTLSVDFKLAVCPLSCECDAMFEHVTCVNASLHQVPSGLPLQVRHLDLSKNIIKEISMNDFTHIPHLQTLNLADNALDTISSQAFANMPALRQLDLHGNHLNQSQLSALSQVPWVAMVNLSANHLAGELDADTFQEMAGLQVLDLSHNQLTSLPADVFNHMPALTSLRLQHNELNHLSLQLHSPLYYVDTTSSLNVTVLLEDGNHTSTAEAANATVNVTSLSSHPSLTELLLSSNHLMDIDSHYFDAFPGLVELDLSHNHLRSVSDLWSRPLINLTYLSLSYNPLEDIPNKVLNVCSNLTDLQLSHMPNLTHINSKSFAGLEQLEELNLGQNPQLGYIHAGAFNMLTSLVTLDLSNSNITSLHEDTFSNLTSNSIQHIDMSGISLECSCDTAWLEDWLITYPSLLTLTPNTTCLNPRANQTKPILLTDFHLWNLSCHSAHITSHPSPLYYLRVGKSALLTCLVGGEPAPSVHWVTNRGVELSPHHPAFIDHSSPGPQDRTFHLSHYWHLSPHTYYHDIPLASRMTVLNNGSLYIDYVTRLDGGPFTCHARNHLGNGTVVLTVKLDYSIIGEVCAWSVMVGMVMAFGFLFIGVGLTTIRHYTHFCSREEKEKRNSIRELLQTISEYKAEKFDNFKAYKTAKMDKIYEFKNNKIDRIRTYKQATVTNILTHMHSMREHYQVQVTRVKENYTQQVDRLRDNYSVQVCKFKDYRVEKIDTVRDNYHHQAIKIREYGSMQMQRLRDQYKLQQQHLLKLLELLDIGNCMSVIEAECMRTDSMLFDPNITFDLEQPVHVPREFMPPSSDSEYLTAGSQSDVRELAETDGSSTTDNNVGGIGTRVPRHKRSSSDTSSASDHSILVTAAQQGREMLRMCKVRRKPRKKRKKWHSGGSEEQHAAQFHNTHGGREGREVDVEMGEAGDEDSEGEDSVVTPPSSLPVQQSPLQQADSTRRETSPGQDSQTSGDYESAKQSREQSIEPHSPDSDRTLTPEGGGEAEGEDCCVVVFDNDQGEQEGKGTETDV